MPDQILSFCGPGDYFGFEEKGSQRNGEAEALGQSRIIAVDHAAPDRATNADGRITTWRFFHPCRRGEALTGPHSGSSSLSDLTKNGSETEITMRFLIHNQNYLPSYDILLIVNCAKRLSPTGC